MVEELKKYKQILEREDREFREVMKVEVSTALSSESKKKVNSSGAHFISHSTVNFAKKKYISLFFQGVWIQI